MAMEYSYIDIHSHLNISPFYEEREAVLARMREKGVATITVGVDLETSKRAVEIAEVNSDVWATIGLHPTDNDKEVFDYDVYLALAKHERVVAIGECGLDYFRNQDSEMKQKQDALFRKHIEVAQQSGKPLMIHARPMKGSMDAYEDVLNILESLSEAPKVNFHFFVGDVTIAKRILAIGGTMSFDGPITFTTDYDEVLAYVPIESIHAETDAPFAAPAPYRGQKCEPWMVMEVIKKIALIKELPLEEVATQLRANAKSFFGI